MSMKYIGASIDIHGGGLENQFPHHECEIAQSEAATGKPFVKYWLHNNMVTVDGRKMGKSLGNFLTLKDAFARWRPPVIRFFILQSHYRSTLDFSNEAVEGAARGLEKLTNTVRNLTDRIRTSGATGDGTGIDPDRVRSAFLAAMDDDFNTPQAIAVLFDLVKELNLVLAREAPLRVESLQQAESLLHDLAGGILGITLAAPAAVTGDDRQREDEMMELLIALRADIRAQKLWALSDKIRDGLAAVGIALEDRKEGTTWKRTS